MMNNTSRYAELACREPLRYPFNGFGVQWDEFLNTENCRGAHMPPDAIPEDGDFEFICRRAVQCGVKKIRMFFRNGLITPTADSEARFNDPRILDSLKLLDFCQKQGIRVCVVFCDCVSFDENGRLNLEKCEPEPYVHSVLSCLTYLLETRKYSCIKEITCFHEPDVDIDHYRYSYDVYFESCRRVREGLIRLGLKERVLLNLSDNLCSAGMQHFIRSLQDVGDLYNNHNYLNSEEDSNEFLTFVTKMGVHASSKYDKPFTIGEFGWDNGLTDWGVGAMSPWGQEGIEKYSRGMFLARYAIQALNTGAVGVSYRSFYDTYYAPDPAKKWTAGLFGFKDDGWQCRPQYYAYGLMMKYADIGAVVRPISSDMQSIVAVFLQNPDKSITCFVANDAQNAEHFRLALPTQDTLCFRVFSYCQDRLPVDDSLPPASGSIIAENGILSYVIPGNSLLVLTTKQNG